MEHIVQIAIGVDDEAIRKRIIDKAEQEIKDSIKQDVLNKIFEAFYYHRDADPKTDPLQNWVKDIVRDIISEYKEEIVTGAVNTMAKGLLKTKMVKELVKETLGAEEQKDENV